MAGAGATLKQELSELRRRRILREAERLFFERGYEQATLDAIAAALGVSKPYIYADFRDKSELLFAVCRAPMEALLAAAAEAARRDGTAEDRLTRFIEGLTRLLCRHHAGIAVYYREEKHLAAAPLRAIAAARLEINQQLVAIIADGIASREFGIADARLAALFLTGMIGWMYSWYDPARAPPAERLAQRFVALGLRLVRHRRPRHAEPLALPAPVSAEPVPAARDGKRERILAAATALFFEQGYGTTTLDAVALRLGVSKPFIYGCFPGKAALLAEIAKRAAWLSIAALEEGAGAAADPRAELIPALARFVRVVMDHRANTAVFFREEKHLAPDDLAAVKDLRKAIDRRIAAILERGAASGAFAVEQVPFATLAITGMASWMYTWFRSAGPAADAAVTRAFVEFALNLVEPPTQAS